MAIKLSNVQAAAITFALTEGSVGPGCSGVRPPDPGSLEREGAALEGNAEGLRPDVAARRRLDRAHATLEDQLTAMWATKRPDLGEERRARLLGKLGEVRS